MQKEQNISIIVAMTQCGAIGKGNDLLVHIPGDLKRFKDITTGHSVIMGRNTFDSLPKGPLPNRRNIILSRNTDLKIEGAEVVNTVDSAIDLVKGDDEVFIIGGGKIYEQFLPLANKLYLTIVEKEFDADTFFPDLNLEEWMEVSRIDKAAGEVADFAFSYVNLTRK